MRSVARLMAMFCIVGIAAGFYLASDSRVLERLGGERATIAARRLRDWARLSDPATRWSPQSRRLLARAGSRLDEMLVERDSTLLRWADGDTLRVWIERRPDLRAWGERHRVAARSALLSWHETGVPLDVVFVDAIEASNVQVRWVERLPIDTLGITNLTFDDALGMRSGEVRIALHDHRGDPLEGARIEALLLHETGHLLGLAHTADQASIMHPSSRAPRISLSDLETLLFLYALPFGRVLPGR